MKKMLMVNSGEHLSASFRAAFVVLLGLALASVFWAATAPSAVGAEMTPLQMLQAQLPAGKTVQTANHDELAGALCAAVKSYRDAAPQIVKAVIATGKISAREAVSISVRCLGSRDCALVAEVVAVGVNASPDDASAIIDDAIAQAPDCRDAIGQVGRVGGGGGNFSNAPAINQNPPPGSVGGGGGGFNPEESRVTVCDNGTEVLVFASQLDEFLRTHPGAFAGPCQPTPVTNK